ncbi:MAG: hypothetical protein CL878_06215, partial [Dehalococcoidia bacterium]|nr:hypothetical protein [Dehalococcoidia bacterium]
RNDDGAPTVYVTLAVPPQRLTKATFTKGNRHVSVTGRFSGTDRLFLEYPVGDKVLVEAVNEEGVLGRLVELAETLSRRFRWQPYKATAFILTGTVPGIAIHATVSYHGTYDRATSRVVLEVPAWFTPKQVADAYRQGRRSLGLGRLGPLKAKTAQLVAFVVARLEGAASPPMRWKGLCAEWDRSFPQWAYKDTAPVPWKRLASDFRRVQLLLLRGTVKARDSGKLENGARPG